MHAHALTVILIEDIDFPFMVLLASGGHCLLAIAQDIDQFLILGSTVDVSPGDAFDKTARAMKLHTLPQFHNTSFGSMLEQTAKGGDHKSFEMKHSMFKYRDCNFSFSGLGAAALRIVQEEYERQNWPEDEVLPNVSDISAWFQHIVVYHIAKRLQRAFIFDRMEELLGKHKTLVVSGGVASNSYLRSTLQKVCDLHDCELVCPPIKLCTDNGIMIAWNGMEKLLSSKDCFQDPDTVDVKPRSPIGQDISNEVLKCSIKTPQMPFLKVHVDY